MDAKWTVCEYCSREFIPKKPTQRFCSLKCVWPTNGRNQVRKKISWGKPSPGRYICGFVRDENGVPIRTSQHRYFMEQHLGRKLVDGEVVHHINGNIHDNRIENLEVMSVAEHLRLHSPSRDHSSHSKLTSHDVLEIRNSKLTNVALAKRLNVDPSVISRARNGKSYRAALALARKEAE